MKSNLLVGVFLISLMPNLTAIGDEQVADICERLNEAKQEYASLSTRYAATHPEMVSLRNHIELLTAVALERYPEASPKSVCGSQGRG